MENTKYGKRRKGRWTPIRAKAQDTRANHNSWETHLVRKRWDIGLLRALSLQIMMMMMMMTMTMTMTVLKFVCCTVLMMVCSYNSQHIFRAWWPAVLWNGLLLFGGTKGYIQMTMVAMGSNNARVKNSL